MNMYLILLITILVIIYLSFQWRFSHWKRLNIPFIEPKFPFGNLPIPYFQNIQLTVLGKKFYDHFKQGKIKYGGIFLGPSPVLFICCPNLVKTIFAKDYEYFESQGNFVDENVDPYGANVFNMDGEKWREMRAKLSSTFSTGKIKVMFNLLVQVGKNFEKQIGEFSKSEQPFNAYNLTSCYSMDSLGSCGFGVDCKSFENPNSEFISTAKLVFSLRLVARRILASISPFLVAKFDITFFSKKVMDFYKKVFEEIYAYRENNTEANPNDFVQLLVDLKRDPKEKFTLENITAQAIAFFAASFENTASNLHFCLFELARNPDIQTKVREEIRDVLKKHNDELTYENIADMVYLEKVILETLRMYPPVGNLQRLCTKNYKLPNNSIIKSGTTIFVSGYGLHMDEEYFPHPTIFNPERFSEENKAKRNSYVYLPFGEGPRKCLGLRFAMLQLKVGVISVCRDFEIFEKRHLKYPLEFKPNEFILASNESIILNVKKIV